MTDLVLLADRAAPRTADAALRAIGRAAVRALYLEVALEPKPGLVSFRDTGSHDDMDAGTFLRSLFALRGYFPRIARAGFEGAPFDALAALGRAAEVRMLRATGGVNTHRGAVFALGLLCAAAGRLAAQGAASSPAALRGALNAGWGDALRARTAAERLPPQPGALVSNGQAAGRRHGLRSANAEAAQGFPTLFDAAWPAWTQARAAGASPRAARVQALFAAMATLDDTNLVHRGGIDALRFVQARSRAFLDAGGVLHDDGLDDARALHRMLVVRRLSPGGSADVVAAVCWLDALMPFRTSGVAGPAASRP